MLVHFFFSIQLVFLVTFWQLVYIGEWVPGTLWVIVQRVCAYYCVANLVTWVCTGIKLNWFRFEINRVTPRWVIDCFMRSNKIKTHACGTHRGSPWLDLSLCGPLRSQIFLPPAEVATLKMVCYSKRASEWHVLILSSGAEKFPHARVHTYRWYLFFIFLCFHQLETK